MLPDQRRQLRVARADLLQDRLQHARLRLHNLAQLLELRVRAQEIQVAGAGAAGSGRVLHALGGVQGPGGFGDLAAAGAGAGSGAAVGLGGGFEEVDGGVGVGGDGVGGRGGGGSGGGGVGGGI